MEQSGQLILNGAVFALESSSDTKCYLFDSDEDEGTLTIGFDARFRKALYQGEWVSPSICINAHETGKTSVQALIGCTYRANSLEETTAREDTFYLYEHEPLVNYQFTIAGLSEGWVHVLIEGTAITDGYSTPRKSSPFSGDFWLPL